MIPIEVLKQVQVVYCHAKCPDGLASAMILKNAFRMLGMSPRIEFLVHGTEEHFNAGAPVAHDDSVVLFCDIAPHPGGRVRSSAQVIVLDHHKGAEEIVRSFGDLGVFADEKREPGVSGAVLAWREVWMTVWTSYYVPIVGMEIHEPSLPYGVENFAACVGARDTWQTQDPRFMRGQWISKMLMSKPPSYWLEGRGDGHGGGPLAYITEDEITIGCALFEAHEEAVRQAVEQCSYVEVPDLRLSPEERELYLDGGVAALPARVLSPPVMRLFVFQEQASGFRLTSDVAEALRARPPHLQAVVAGFAWTVDKPGAPPRLVWSLRGLGGFDVAAFASAHGGGGHTAAAGFACFAAPNASPYEWIASQLRLYLEGGR